MKKTCLILLFIIYLFMPAFQPSILGKIAPQFSPGMFTKAALAADAYLELDPSSGAISTSGTDIDVNIDTDGQAIKSAKAVINYPTAMLQVSSITAGDFLDDVSHNIYNDEGEVIINANLSLDSMLESKTGTGTIATITFEAQASSGTAIVTFDCTDEDSTDSNINDPSDPPLDIITCTANVDGNYSWGDQAASPSPAASAIVSASPGVGGNGTTTAGGTTSGDLVSGVTAPTIFLLLAGFALLLAPVFL
jgi:hypothetical protein